MISNFEADVSYLHNPTLIPQFFSLSNIEEVAQLYSFCKYGALFLAIFATISHLIRRSNLTFIYLRTIKPSSTEPVLQYLSEDFDFSDDDDDDCSSVSSNNEEELISPAAGDRDFSVAGQKSIFRFRRRRSSYELFPLTEFVAGTNVVNVWESNFLTVRSPAMVFDDKNSVVFAAYDTRMRREFPAICAEWGTGKMVGIGSGGGERFYVRDEVARVMKVADLRKVKTLVEMVAVTENDGEMWRDAGAVVVDDELVDR